MATRPLIVIVCQTASGKTELAIKLAKRFDGEIICADSRTIYKDMDIGTAKPTIAEMGGVRHYMLDLVTPNQSFTLSDFQQLADKFIKVTRRHEKTPFLVGGSGLYIDSILFDYRLGEAPKPNLRKKLEQLDEIRLLKLLKKQHIEIPSNFHNKRHLIRAIEQNGINRSRRTEIIGNTVVVGIATNKKNIEKSIRRRAEHMLDLGLIQEVKNLIQKYGNDVEPLRKNLYGEVQKYLLDKSLTRQSLIERMIIVDRQLVKKQLTWFRRNQFIQWLPIDCIEEYLVEKLDQTD
jgi:tRNA dimethylallyltransferase